MTKPTSAGPEFPQSTIPELLKMTDSDEALFGLEPVKKRGPILPLVSPAETPEPRRSEAWDDIAIHDGPFVAPRDEGQVLAVHQHTPNPITGGAVRRIQTNRAFGLHGIVDRTLEQDENVRIAAERGQEDKEKRDIASGMSEDEARARRMVRALRKRERS